MIQNGLVEFLNERCLSISEDQTILNVAVTAGIPLFHVCGGKARCSTCRVLVVEGAEWLTSPNGNESLLNEQMHFSRNVRLACQTKVTGGHVKLRRIIQDETDMHLYIGDGLRASSQQIGEERELVLFFLDLRNFTPFVESHLAFDIIHIVRKLFSVFQNIIEGNNGKIIETAGDGLYAVFGCHTSPKQSIQSSVQAALLILQDIETLNETYFKVHFNENVQIGIGVHIGRVISGVLQIGSEERMIVMGYPVNIASRLQNATKSLNNSLVISSDVYNLLLNPPKARSASITLKGVSNKLTVYLLGKPYN